MKNIFKILLIAILLCTCFIIVQTRNFNGFQLAHFYEERTKVCRDYQERYKKEWSYKIESTDYNDFMIYKKIQVKKNTAYKVSCMVKTQNIQSEDEKNYTGFNICLKDSLEK